MRDIPAWRGRDHDRTSILAHSFLRPLRAIPDLAQPLGNGLQEAVRRNLHTWR